MRRVLMVVVLALLASDPALAQTSCSLLSYCPPATGGPGGGAPTDAQYVTAAADGTLTAERVCTDTSTIDCDAGTAGQMKFNLITPIRVATGCATPNFSFTDDTNAGLCLGAADDFTIQTAASGNSRTWIRGTSTMAEFAFTDSGGNVTEIAIGDEMVFAVNSSQLLRFGDTLGSGFLVGKGGATPAVVRSIAAGTGITVANGDGQSGNPTPSVDTATTPQFSSGTGDVPATGAQGTWYYETDTASGIYTYPSTDTETWVMSLAAGVAAGKMFQTSATDVLTTIDPTDDRVLVGNGSTWELKAVPDCDDSGGNHLNYDTGTNAFSCGTTSNTAQVATVTANTGSTTTTAAQTGVVFTNTGDSDGSSITLLNDPTAGVHHSVAVDAAQTITVSPSSGETLYLNAASCANVTSNTVGAALSVVAVIGGSGGKWVASGSGWTCN